MRTIVDAVPDAPARARAPVPVWGRPRGRLDPVRGRGIGAVLRQAEVTHDQALAVLRSVLDSAIGLFSFFLGGVAALCDGQRVGAVGVSGLPGEVDEELAIAAIRSAGLEAPG